MIAMQITTSCRDRLRKLSLNLKSRHGSRHYVAIRKHLAQTGMLESTGGRGAVYHLPGEAIPTPDDVFVLIKLAKDLDAATKQGKELGLTDDEKAFYDALAANESAVKAMGSLELRVIAAELVTQVRKSVTIDWTLRESARAKIKVMVKRILNKYGYPPDLQEEATKTVLAQAELLSAIWVEC